MHPANGCRGRDRGWGLPLRLLGDWPMRSVYTAPAERSGGGSAQASESSASVLCTMGHGVPFDKLLDKLGEVDGLNQAPDGRWTPHPVRRLLTLTGSKYAVGNEYVIAEAEDWDDFEMRWESDDLFALRVDAPTFSLRREQVGEILDVYLPEQPYHRTVSIDLVTELTIDFTVEYEHREPSEPS